MNLVDFTSADPAMHLACDEALLAQAEAGRRGGTLRFCELTGPVVVLGIGSEWRREIDRVRCRREGVPVLRRSSGGGAVVLARGCLNYAAVIDTRLDPALRGIRESYGWVLSRLAAALAARGIAAAHRGLSDLVWRNRKIGGSAQRRKRRFILHHGTLLYAFDLSLLDAFLGEPPRPPDYRAGRDHGTFATNVDLPREELEGALREAFGIPPEEKPVDVSSDIADEAASLAAEKYRRNDWTFRA